MRDSIASFHYCLSPGCAALISNTIGSALCKEHRKNQDVRKVSSSWRVPPTLRKNNHRETVIVHQNLSRAREIHALATLTLDQWLFTLDYFQWECAYCRVREYTILEHFIPIGWGGGTTQDNCVPACQGCNRRKGWFYPLINLPEPLIPMKSDLKRVCAYLRSLREQAVIQLPLFP
jgi:5-methylcytosine-specific restriction endonuclease McrA